MGLDTTHGAWNGAYSAFMRWRKKIAELCGLGDLSQFEGYDGIRPLSDIQDEGIRILLSHSDCDGELTPEECEKIASSLSLLLAAPINIDDMGGHIGNFKFKTETFIRGCQIAVGRNENIVFG